MRSAWRPSWPPSGWARGALAGTNDFYVTGYGSFDLSSGYVLYGARENDEPCYWTYGEFNVGYGKLGSRGASVWQNTDMTTRRKETMRRKVTARSYC